MMRRKNKEGRGEKEERTERMGRRMKDARDGLAPEERTDLAHAQRARVTASVHRTAASLVD